MNILKDIIARAVALTPQARKYGFSAETIAESLTPPPKQDMGDLALSGFELAKVQRVKPPQAIAALAEELRRLPEDRGIVGPGALCSELRETGPYLNFVFDSGQLARVVLDAVEKAAAGDDPGAWCYGNCEAGRGRTVLIDYSGPNIAKPLGVHHLRSTMIGNSLKRIYEACGWTAVGINHLGDWGTSFGKLIAGFWDQRAGTVRELSRPDISDDEIRVLFRNVGIAALNAAYVDFSHRAKANPEMEGLGKYEFSLLEKAVVRIETAGVFQPATDDERKGLRNYRLWREIKRISTEEFERVYALLGIGFIPFPPTEAKTRAHKGNGRVTLNTEYSFYTGESFFVAHSNLCDEAVKRAETAGIVESSEGARVIFTDGRAAPPLILLKDDGATSYHTRDIAAALYRRETFSMDKALYVVGGEQRLHFRQLFKALDMMGEGWAKDCEHVDFGIVLVKDEESGKWTKFSTRAGKVVLLDDLLQEAIANVRRIIAEKNPALAARGDSLEEVARAVGVGAVVFNDLKHSRRADVKFDWDEMLDFSGETGPYMLYQYVRLGSVARKYRERFGARPGGNWAEADAARLTLPHERELLKAVAAFPEVVARACVDNEPSVVSRYLLDLSSTFSSYWTATREEGIVGDDQALSAARIAVVQAVRRVLGRGLQLLGLRLVEEM